MGKGSAFSTARAEAIAKAADTRNCLLEPNETEGPFPGDGSNIAHGRLANVLERSGIVRREMRANVGNTAIATQGQALDLEITLEKAGRGCKPLAGHAIYIWQCDALGRYSIYDVPNASYLRAVGVTDTAGKAVFTTIFPGCYSGTLSAHPFRSLRQPRESDELQESAAHLRRSRCRRTRAARSTPRKFTASAPRISPR